MLLDAFQLGERVLQQVDNLRTLVHAITVVAQIGACGRNLKASHLYEVVDDFKILYIAIRIVAHLFVPTVLGLILGNSFSQKRSVLSLTPII